MGLRGLVMMEGSPFHRFLLRAALACAGFNGNLCYGDGATSSGAGAGTGEFISNAVPPSVPAKIHPSPVVNGLPQSDATIPLENQAPSPEGASFNGARLSEDMLRILSHGDISTTASLGFFPEGPFIVLKKVPQPKQYYDQLVAEYQHDLDSIRKKIPAGAQLRLEKIIPGSCKWKPIGSEYNNIAYWSCYKTRFRYGDDEHRYELIVKVTINWGDQWYVTHLGRGLRVDVEPSQHRSK
jgi:hypothetical protein